ncbi:hypothetical protein [Bacillus sp. REN3]|uniref:hypothetical protein n=1 Tax=Bacillus sp. REN3 TaxID=2802440 RepID=UPI001AEEB629|nr:hypothetical protein [Bacillus sp. REN3]
MPEDGKLLFTPNKDRFTMEPFAFHRRGGGYADCFFKVLLPGAFLCGYIEKGDTGSFFIGNTMDVFELRERL